MRTKLAQQQWCRVFADLHKFQDDVWGQITLNTLERDVIDTPEFQRLFRTSQLGFVDLVYQTANHTRGAHSIGACHVANDLMIRLAKNTVHDRKHSRYAPIDISSAERVLIRLGALLHDISHVPFSHDIERKSHLIYYNTEKGDYLKIRSHYGHYDKHDDYASNPYLYLVLFDTTKSILARVLRAYSHPFYAMLSETDFQKEEHSHLRTFLNLLSKAQQEHQWDPARELLPALLFHLLTYETQEEAKDPVRRIVTRYANAGRTFEWGLGPPRLQPDMHRAWYQPFRHDIIGNTLSADLIDYLKRDMRRLGMDREIDLHLLSYYVLVNPHAKEFRQAVADQNAEVLDGSTSPPSQYRCAIEIQDHKRGTSRVVLINDIFRLLDLRHEIHEKAVMHRVVQSANAMFSRALLLMRDAKPEPWELANLGDGLHALQGEELFLLSLAGADDSKCKEPLTDSAEQARRIIRKLVDRRVYRPLVIIPGDRAAEHFRFAGNKDEKATEQEYFLRTLGAVVDSTYYSRFLLFVSACIEEFLLGLVDSDKEVLQQAKTIVEDPERRKQAMDVVPSRVIIWTTPYKQLYKDPAVVVALKSKVARIDDLARWKSGDALTDESLFKLVRASIDDADSKYAALWKLYVFVSDGLYYTGILNKLKTAKSNGQVQRAASHIGRIRNAEALVVAALDVIYDDWSNHCREQGDTKARERRLVGYMDEDRFTALVELWVAKYKAQESRNQNPTRGLSEVDVEHYVHQWDPSGCPVEDKCRDIRYKFPAPSDNAWREAKALPPTELGRQLVEFLEKCGVTDPGMLSDAEFKQLMEQFTPATAERCEALRKNSVDGLDASHLNLLWPSALLRGAEVQAVPREESDPFADAGAVHELPTTQKDTERWLLNEARILETHVRKQLTTNAEAIAQLVMSYPPVSQQAIFADLRTRLLSESKLLNNNMKSNAMLAQLRRKWDKLAAGPAAVEAPGDDDELN